MTKYSVKELLSLWAKGELTSEQAIGHLIQNLVACIERIDHLEKRIKTLVLLRDKSYRQNKR